MLLNETLNPWVTTVVFPDPGPARTIIGPSLWLTAADCASLNGML